MTQTFFTEASRGKTRVAPIGNGSSIYTILLKGKRVKDYKTGLCTAPKMADAARAILKADPYNNSATNADALRETGLEPRYDHAVWFTPQVWRHRGCALASRTARFSTLHGLVPRVCCTCQHFTRHMSALYTVVAASGHCPSVVPPSVHLAAERAERPSAHSRGRSIHASAQ